VLSKSKRSAFEPSSRLYISEEVPHGEDAFRSGVFVSVPGIKSGRSIVAIKVDAKKENEAFCWNAAYACEGGHNS